MKLGLHVKVVPAATQEEEEQQQQSQLVNKTAGGFLFSRALEKCNLAVAMQRHFNGKLPKQRKDHR